MKTVAANSDGLILFTNKVLTVNYNVFCGIKNEKINFN